MINSYALGFVAVAAATVFGADYVVQSRTSGSAPGAYSLADHVAGFSARLDDVWASIDKARRRREAAREHLPEAVAGFERRSWERDGSGDEARMAGMSFLERRLFKKALEQARKAAREEVWEYVRGAERFRLSARFEPLPEGGREGPLAVFVAPGLDLAKARLEGFDIVRGVPFLRVIGDEREPDGNAEGPLMLLGFLGQEVAIGVYAERPFAELAEVLEAIDYDRLNAMLDIPLAGVGSDARPLPPAGKAALLQAAARRFGRAGATVAAGAEPAGPADVRRVTLGSDQALAGAKNAAGVRRLGVRRPGAGRAGTGDRPTRLMLSGGRSCLGGAGRFCD